MTAQWSNRGSSTIPQALKNACEKWPNKTYLDFSGEKYTFAEVDRESTRIAHGLVELGVAAGDRVCAIMGNVVDIIFVWFAVNKLGAVWVPINTDFKGEYLRHQIADAGASVIVVEPHFADRVFGIEDKLPELKTLVCRGELPKVQSRLQLKTLDSIRSSNTSPVTHQVSPSDLALLIYTSGTTGPSKGCMVSQNYALNFGGAMGKATHLTDKDIVHTPCPMFHSAGAFGVILMTLQAGAGAAISPRFSVTNFWSEIEQSGATASMLLSIMLRLIPEAPDSDVARRCFGKLRTVFGSPFPGKLKDQWREKFGVKYPASPAYGMTEACPVFLTPIDLVGVPESASGRLYEDYEARIIDDKGNECPPNVPGEIYLRPTRPDIMFLGYWRRPESTTEVWRDLWFHTGDIGKIDENGFFYFVDRKKDYLRRGGENISSFEVEATFLGHNEVAEVAVHSVPSDLSEDELKVTVVLHPGATVTEEVLCVWSLDRLPHFAVPRYIEFRKELPKTATHRVQKHVLRSDGVTTATWDRSKSSIVIQRRR